MIAWLHAQVELANTGIDITSMFAAGGIVTLAYLVYGMTGFGSSIIAIPMLTQLVPLRTATPVMLVLDLAAGVLVGWRNLRAVQAHELRRLGPWLCIGLGLGVTVLVSAPEKPLELVLGVCLLSYSLWKVKARGEFRQIGGGWALPLGFFGGCLTAVFGTGGPVYTIYLAGRLSDADQRRATISTLISLTAVARLLLFGMSGLYRNSAVLHLAGWLLPCSAAGLVIGSRLRNSISTASVLTFLWIILIISAINLIVRSAPGIFS